MYNSFTENVQNAFVKYADLRFSLNFVIEDLLVYTLDITNFNETNRR